jgi:hypothetical protein
MVSIRLGKRKGEIEGEGGKGTRWRYLQASVICLEGRR